MALRPAAYVAMALVGGGVLGWLFGRRLAPTKPGVPAASWHADEADVQGLTAANSNLARELAACNRRVVRLARGASVEGDPSYAEPGAELQVASLLDADAGAGAALLAALPSRLDAGGAVIDGGSVDPDAGTAVRDLPFAELSADEWARSAEKGAVPYRIPCLRDNPWKPPARELDKLGLAPQDSDAIREAYGGSNQRVLADVRPLCASVVGAALVDRLGASACLKVVIDATRRDDPKALRQALTRVAEANAGKRPPPSSGSASPIEGLLYGLTGEAKTFAADLAARLGPEDAQRILSAKWLCREGGTVNADTGGPKRPSP